MRRKEEDYKAIEAYLKKLEEERRRFAEEQEEERRRAIEFLKEHTFVIGRCNGEDDTEITLRFNRILQRLRELYGVNFYTVPWEGKVLAIPSEVGANVCINVRELLKHAKRFGESLDFFFAEGEECYKNP